jgi:V8-like Glu-specific endopeptidase
MAMNDTPPPTPPSGGGVTGILILCALIAVLVFLLVPRDARAQSANDFAKTSGATTTLERKALPDAMQAQAERYDTREARLAAKPLDWTTTIGKPKKLPAAPKQRKRLAPGASESGKPNAAARSEAEKLYPDEWRGLRELSQPQAAAAPHAAAAKAAKTFALPSSPSTDVFTQYCENCPNVNSDAPVAVGKLFSNAGTCTASVISGNNVIVTAAHCCYDRSSKNWIGGWSFAPAYNQGYAPYGTFGWSSATILTSWINNGDIPSDVCVIRLQNDAQNRGVTYYTGWLGRSWDWGATQSHHALGYPGNLGNANSLELCTSQSFAASSACGGDGVLNTGCSMTYGSSGGPWIRNYRSDNWVNAVVHGYSSDSCTGTFGKTFNGPRFTSGNIATLCNAIGC